jgi:hypothetical protein
MNVLGEGEARAGGMPAADQGRLGTARGSARATGNSGKAG